MALSFIAKWLTYREPGAKEIDYLAAYLVATDSVAVEEWIVEVSGGKGRPRNVDPYLPPLDSLRHRRRVFRQWLVLGLGWDKQTNRWVFAREQPSEVSLSEEIGEDTDGDGEPVTRGDLITDESIVAIDPATFLFHRRPSLRFAFEYLEVAQGWRPGHRLATTSRQGHCRKQFATRSNASSGEADCTNVTRSNSGRGGSRLIRF
jgi:hypothetical protein